MKHNLIKIAVVAAVSGGICLWQTPARAEVSGADKEFLKKASDINVAEVQAGELAQKKGTSSQVKMMAEHIVKDHKKAEEELQKLAKSKGVELKEETPASKKKEESALEKASGEKFDNEFMEQQAKGHETAIKLFETEAKKGSDPDVKAWAEKMIPGLKSHLSMAQGGQGGETKKGGAGEKAKGEKSSGGGGGHEHQSGGNQ